MRDVAITLLIFSTIPFILKYPWVGVLVFVWISVFSPHRFAWGFAYDFQFAMIIAVVTLSSMVLHAKEVRLQASPVIALLILLPLWMTVTTVFALGTEETYERWKLVMKVFLFVLVGASLLHTRKQLEALLWVMAVSVGFYGVKGGVFTLRGNSGLVWGPPGETYITDNNALAVAMIMVIPLMYYLRTVSASPWVRRGLLGAMLLTGMAILGTHSRGGFLAVVAMLCFLWLKSHRKFVLGLLLVVISSVAIGLMSERWAERMESIATYEQDNSAMTRLNSWQMAFNLANDRPIVGGGFEIYTPEIFARYAPNPREVYAAHSIYFQILGEHGYVGLFLFLALGIAAWRVANRTIAAARDRPDIAWTADLARAIQVSLVGFGVGGAFVNIAYWEIQYYEMVVLVAAWRLSKAAERKKQDRVMAPSVAGVELATLHPSRAGQIMRRR